MTPRDFVYWLQGYAELSDGDAPNDRQWSVIQNHLNLVFKHEIDSPDPTGELQETHDGKPNPVFNGLLRPPGARC